MIEEILTWFENNQQQVEKNQSSIHENLRFHLVNNKQSGVIISILTSRMQRFC